jgi:hypothetical protein
MPGQHCCAQMSQGRAPDQICACGCGVGNRRRNPDRESRVGTIYASMFLTVDGVMEAPHVWHPPYVSEESMTMLAEQLAGATAMLLGRQTYEDSVASSSPRDHRRRGWNRGTPAVFRMG